MKRGKNGLSRHSFMKIVGGLGVTAWVPAGFMRDGPGLGPGGELSQGISQNPFFTFPMKVTQPGKLTVTFLDTTGKKYEGSAEIKF